MAVPWLAILDTVLGMTQVVRRVRQRVAPGEANDALASTARGGGPLEARLAGVVVAALKEAFDRDHQRLELEREQIEAERRRAERAMRLELARQAGEREVSRLRLLAGIAATGSLGLLFLARSLVDAGGGAPVLGTGGLLLLGGLASSFVGQAAVARALDRVARQSADGGAGEEISSGRAGAAATWLVVSGLAALVVALLL
jgi:hypothetical protein